jgi:Zn-dependent peptidase ImmA (M78 family)
MSGMVHRKPDGTAVIGVNSMEAPTRQRFTIAHELGHLLLHKDEDLHVDERFPIAFRNPKSSQAIDDKEIEANQFAAELLMPEEFILKDLKGKDLDIEDDDLVAELAAKYEVSTQAMTIRLSRLARR